MSLEDSGRSHLDIPTGTWVRLAQADGTQLVAYTYINPEGGLTARGKVGDKTVVVALPAGRCEMLDPQEVIRLGLPEVPDWLQDLGPQPTIGTSWGAWQAHPKLLGKFHPQNPDDVQVLVHDGGPRLCDTRPELLWVRVNNVSGSVFGGLLVERPAQLTSIKQAEAILFVVPDGGKHPLRVTRKYLDEKQSWKIHACQTCGLTELFDAPSDLVRVVFPDLPAGAKTSMFTAKCGACGGIQGLESKSTDADEDEAPATLPPRWWQVWKK